MKDLKSFDSELKMFRESPRPVNVAHLGFLRWLGEQGRLEHPVAGPSAGELVQAPAAEGSLVEAA